MREECTAQGQGGEGKWDVTCLQQCDLSLPRWDTSDFWSCDAIRDRRNEIDCELE